MARSPRKAAAIEADPAVAAPASSNTAEAKAHFSKALDEAKAGAGALGKEAKERGGVYREKVSGAIAAKRADLTDDAKALTREARDKAASLANDGKARASDALTGLGNIVADKAPVIDEHLGEKYGDYARTAARTIQETAAKIEAKDLAELGDDARAFVRRSPGLAIGMAAVAGFMLARLFRGSED